MAARVIQPEQFTREEIERRMDELARRYHETHDKKVLREIERLSRVLGKLKRHDAAVW
jgi:FKBP-type peptidyl-prolyl cis-trans isomerase (trigger factor)